MMLRRGDSLRRIDCTLLLLLTTISLPSTYGKWRPAHSKHTLAGIAAERENRSGRPDAGIDRPSLAPQGVVVDKYGQLVDLAIPVDETDEPLQVRTTLAQHGDPLPSTGAGSVERGPAEEAAEYPRVKPAFQYCKNTDFGQVGVELLQVLHLPQPDVILFVARRPSQIYRVWCLCRSRILVAAGWTTRYWGTWGCMTCRRSAQTMPLTLTAANPTILLMRIPNWLPESIARCSCRTSASCASSTLLVLIDASKGGASS